MAEGIWVEQIGPKMTDDVPEDHPLNNLPTSLPAEVFVLHRLHCELRRNPRPLEDILGASRLCSQKLFQFYLTLDGKQRPSYPAKLRTVYGKSTTRLSTGWPHPDLSSIERVATVEEMMPAWEQYVLKVADRRTELGKIN
jgi:hypothetical protein